jgi:hypothetical protein
MLMEIVCVSLPLSRCLSYTRIFPCDPYMFRHRARTSSASFVHGSWSCVLATDRDKRYDVGVARGVALWRSPLLACYINQALYRTNCTIKHDSKRQLLTTSTIYEKQKPNLSHSCVSVVFCFCNAMHHLLGVFISRIFFFGLDTFLVCHIL